MCKWCPLSCTSFLPRLADTFRAPVGRALARAELGGSSVEDAFVFADEKGTDSLSHAQFWEVGWFWFDERMGADRGKLAYINLTCEAGYSYLSVQVDGRVCLLLGVGDILDFGGKNEGNTLRAGLKMTPFVCVSYVFPTPAICRADCEVENIAIFRYLGQDTEQGVSRDETRHLFIWRVRVCLRDQGRPKNTRDSTCRHAFLRAAIPSVPSSYGKQ